MPKDIRSIDAAYIAKCGDLIVEKLGKENISNWSNADYQELCSEIWRQKKIRLSLNTLKRIFGKIKTEQHYRPHLATLDALATFLAYTDWEDFKNANPLAEDGVPVQKNSKPAEAKIKIGLKLKLLYGLLFLIGIFTVVLVTIFVYKHQLEQTAYQHVRLICKNPKGNNLHSATFQAIFPLGFGDTTAFVLDFGDRSADAITHKKPNINHYYHTPGWYKVRLTYKGELIDSTVVTVKSDGWFAYVNKIRPHQERYRLNDFDGQTASMDKVTNADVIKVGVDTIAQFFLNFVNIKNTAISGDNFELVADVKTSDHLKRGECAAVNFNIYGDFADHYTGLINPECTVWADAIFSEQAIDGIRNDLHELGHNLANGGVVKLQIANKLVKLYLNGKLIYATRYKNPIGNIKGVEIKFSGAGQVRAFSLRDLETGERF